MDDCYPRGDVTRPSKAWECLTMRIIWYGLNTLQNQDRVFIVYSGDIAIRTYNKNKTLRLGEECDPTKWETLLDKQIVRYPSKHYRVLI